MRRNESCRAREAIRRVGRVTFVRRDIASAHDEKANLPRGGDAKPRDSTSRPGCRITSADRGDRGRRPASRDREGQCRNDPMFAASEPTSSVGASRTVGPARSPDDEAAAGPSASCSAPQQRSWPPSCPRQPCAAAGPDRPGGLWPSPAHRASRRHRPPRAPPPAGRPAARGQARRPPGDRPRQRPLRPPRRPRPSRGRRPRPPGRSVRRAPRSLSRRRPSPRPPPRQAGPRRALRASPGGHLPTRRPRLRSRLPAAARTAPLAHPPR